MAENCVRSITFTIPGKNGKPGVEVFVVENADGTLTFTVDVLETNKQGDLRGFYFDINESVLPGLTSLPPTRSSPTPR